MAHYRIDNDPAPLDFEQTGEPGRTLQNAKNLLRLRKGELPYDRSRGFDAALFDLPLSEFRERLLPELDRVLRWEPDAEAVSAEARLREDGTVYITALLELPF